MIAPGHNEGDTGSGNLVDPILTNVISSKAKEGIILLKTAHLERTETVQKSTDGGERSVPHHMDTIRLVNPQEVAGKTVYIIDDVMTTGSTLQASLEVVKRDVGSLESAAPPSAIHLLAVGKTVSYII